MCRFKLNLTYKAKFEIQINNIFLLSDNPGKYFQFNQQKKKIH